MIFLFLYFYRVEGCFKMDILNSTWTAIKVLKCQKNAIKKGKKGRMTLNLSFLFLCNFSSDQKFLWNFFKTLSFPGWFRLMIPLRDTLRERLPKKYLLIKVQNICRRFLNCLLITSFITSMPLTMEGFIALKWFITWKNPTIKTTFNNSINPTMTLTKTEQ